MSTQPTPMKANEVRKAFRLLRRARPQPPAFCVVDPARSDAAVHRGWDGAVQDLLHWRGDPAVPARRDRAEVCPCRRQAQRPRRDRTHEAASDLLRDDGQLLLRRLLQGRRVRLGVGVRHRGHRVARRSSLGHRPPHRRRGRRHLGEPGGCSGRPHSAPRRGQLLEDGRRRPLRPVLGDLLGQGSRVRRRRRPRAWRRGPLHRDLESRVHAVRPAGRRFESAVAEAVDRHRHGSRAHRLGAAGRRLGVGHRRTLRAAGCGGEADRR